MADAAIELEGEQLHLLPERALYWPKAATLFAADIHLGKAAAFRAASIAIPDGTTADDLARLSAALARTGASRLVMLGDLFHARKGRAASILNAVADWRACHSQLGILLVRGNHDLHAGDPPTEWDITCADAPVLLPPFVLHHEPVEAREGYTLAGHVHPGVRLVGSARQELTLPCFWFGPHVAVLPAFSAFTGLAVVKPAHGDRAFVVVDDDIISVT